MNNKIKVNQEFEVSDCDDCKFYVIPGGCLPYCSIDGCYFDDIDPDVKYCKYNCSLTAEQRQANIDSELSFRAARERYRKELEEKRKVMYECFHCGQRTVVWCADFTFEDYGIFDFMGDDDRTTNEGIVHHCHCSNCGADIEYYVPIFEDLPRAVESK